MGCSQSKIENEEAIARCKDRKIHMKDAVAARNAFAAAHSAYIMSLKNTGASLSDYAHGEVQNPQLVNETAQSNPKIDSVAASYEPLEPPPPPLPNFFSPLHRAASMPEINILKSDLKPVPIIEEEDENEVDNEGSVGSLRRRSKKGSGGGGSSRIGNTELDAELEGPPPPPPTSTPPLKMNRPLPPAQLQNTTYDYFFAMDNMPGPTLSEAEEANINEQEIEGDLFDKSPERRENDDIEDRRGGKEAEAVEPPPPPPVVAEPSAITSKSLKKVGGVGSMDEAKFNLLQIFVKLDDHFLKASESAHEVSKMLEATRLHYHSNFADGRGIKIPCLLFIFQAC